jgi:CheY-like chemotaxis protein
MNGVLGVANLLAQTDLTAKQKEYVDAIQLSGNNLMVIINDILDLTKISSGKMSFENIPFNLKEVINTSVFLLKNKAEDKGLVLKVDMDPELNTEITGDPTRLSQVLINLLGNAVKFTEKGFVALRVEKESENEERIDIKFIIEDSGIGISPEKIDAIFEKFTQERSDTTRKFGGTGLGLSITKQLVNLQKGSISVTSKVGAGSCFTFTLSFGKDKQTEQTIELLFSETIKSLEGIRILLAEDNEINQMVAVDTLERWNATVDVAENGKIVLEKMTQNLYDLILMDLQMPEMGGEECTKKIRDNYIDKHSDIPIIAMTASAFKKEKEKCISIGMNGYVSKPFFPEDLYSEISAVLNSRRLDFKKGS